MRASKVLAAVISCACLTTASFAATVNSVGGQVLINKGGGYQQVAGSTQANPGDSILVNPGGSAQIVYPDGCVVEVLPGAVATVAAQSPCATGGFSPGATTFVIGAVVVGGGIGAAVLLSQQSDKSASP